MDVQSLLARVPLSLTLVLLTSSACGPEAPPASAGADTPPAGASPPLVLPTGDRTLVVRVDTLFRLGGADATGWDAFRGIREVAFDHRGLLYILDRGSDQLRVVDGAGGLLRTIGGSGDGFGEISAAVAISTTDDGGVAVFDLGRRSIALFDSAGRYIDNLAVDGTKGRLGCGVLRKGVVLGMPNVAWVGGGTDRMRMYVPAEGGGLDDPPGVPLVRAPLDGSGAEILRWNRSFPPRLSDGRPVTTLFRPEIRWAVLPDGRVAVVDSTAYRIHVVGGGGEDVWMRQVPVREPTAEERRIAEERAANAGGSRSSLATGGGTGGGVRPGPRERVEFHPELQAVQGMRSGPAGRLWVERVGGDVHVPGPIDLLTPEGGYVGTIAEGTLSLPRALGPGGLAVWIDEGELGAEVVTVGRVPS